MRDHHRRLRAPERLLGFGLPAPSDLEASAEVSRMFRERMALNTSCTGPVPTGDADGRASLPPNTSPHAPVRPSVAVDHGNLGWCNTPKPVCDMGTFCWDEHLTQGRSVEAEASSGYVATVAVAAAVLAGLVACLVAAWWWVL